MDRRLDHWIIDYTISTQTSRLQHILEALQHTTDYCNTYFENPNLTKNVPNDFMDLTDTLLHVGQRDKQFKYLHLKQRAGVLKQVGRGVDVDKSSERLALCEKVNVDGGGRCGESAKTSYQS